MFRKKTHLVVAIKTLDLDALRVSIPPLRRFWRKFSLVIYNDNIDVKLTMRMVRALGWRGQLKIINSEKTLGELESRIAIVDFIHNSKLNADWIMFLGDADILIDATLPKISDDVFAFVQNATTLCDSHVDMFRINSGWVSGSNCGKTEPHFDINGTAIRAQIMFEFIEFLGPIAPQVKKVMRDNKHLISETVAMWEMLNAMMRTTHPDMSPIYVNQTNYISIKLGQRNIKSGRGITSRTAARHFASMAEFVAMQNMVAENQ